MKRSIKKIIVAVFLTGFVGVFMLIAILLYPEPLFANKLEHGQFKVYSNAQIDVAIKPILDNALDLVMASELHDSSYTFDIFLSYGSIYNKLDGIFLGKAPSARATDNNVTIKVAVDAQRDLFFPTFYQQCEGNLTYLLAHEMIHCLQENKYGKWKFNPFNHPEMWKLEGYPEYVSRRPQRLDRNYSLVSEIERFIGLESESQDFWMAIEEGGCKAPKYYYKSRLMTEYLMDVEQLSYDQILNDSTPEDSIYAAMIRWKDSLREVD